jgi:hypothetical protein
MRRNRKFPARKPRHPKMKLDRLILINQGQRCSIAGRTNAHRVVARCCHGCAQGRTQSFASGFDRRESLPVGHHALAL